MSRTLSAVGVARKLWKVVALLLFGLAAAGLKAIAQARPPLPLRPSGIAFDSAGDLYFTDAARHCVYQVSLAGVLTVIAGTGVQGYAGDGGAATAAQLNEPQGLVVAADGTVYIADTGNARVRAVQGGLIRTVAGVGTPGYGGDGGQGTAARLNRPAGLALATDGSLSIADSGNQRVRVLRSGVLTTLAGNGVQGFAGDGGAAVQAELSGPAQVAVSTDGRLFIADAGNARLRVVTTDGVIRTFAGTGVEGFAGDGGAATGAKLSRPGGLAMAPAGELYVADSGNQRLRKVGAEGIITTVAGTGVQGMVAEGSAAGSTSLEGPTGVGVSPLGVVWFADGRNSTVRALSGGGLLFQPAGLVTRSTSLSPQVTTGAAGELVLAVGVNGQAGTAQGTVRVSENGTLLGQAAAAGGNASLALAALSAGSHTLTVDYSGDVLNPSATATVNSSPATPGVLVATANAATMRFGEDVPALTGTLAGLPAQAAGRVGVSFTTQATSLSNVGVYPIAPVLRGVEAANYVVQLSASSGELTITPAASSTAMLTPAPNGYAGLPLTLSATVAASAKGKPTGSVDFVENGVVLATTGLVNGSASVLLTALAVPAVGQHAVVARYGGDGNFLPSDSTPQTIAVNVLPDFTLTQVSAAAPTMSPGTAATFSFQVGASPAPFTGAVAFATSGLPNGWIARFAPTNVIPGASSATVVLTVTASGTASLPWRSFSGIVAALTLPLVALRSRKRAKLLRSFLLLVGGALLVTGCGDRVASTADLVPPHPASFTVTGTATNLAGQVVTHAVVVSYLQP